MEKNSNAFIMFVIAAVFAPTCIVPIIGPGYIAFLLAEATVNKILDFSRAKVLISMYLGVLIFTATLELPYWPTFNTIVVMALNLTSTSVLFFIGIWKTKLNNKKNMEEWGEVARKRMGNEVNLYPEEKIAKA